MLDYLAACNRLDATPYQSNYSLIHQIDADCFADYKEDTLELTDDQFRELVGRFQRPGRGPPPGTPPAPACPRWG